jgi:diguanylate cyclase (GGDEF)-like protein/PAS domain S-box-containing protein
MKEVKLPILSDIFFEQIYADAPDPIVLLDKETKVLVHANQAFLKLLGISSQTELNKLTVLDIAPHKQRDGVLSADRVADGLKQLDEHGYVRIEFTYLDRHGQLFDAETTAKVLEHNGYKLIHAHWRDIGEKQKLLLKIEENETSFQRVFDEATSPTVIITAGGNILEVNKATLKMFKYAEKSSMIGRTPFEMAAPIQPNGQTADELGHYLLNLAACQGVIHFEWHMQASDGSVVPTEVTLTLIHGYKSQHETVIHCSIRDLTEQYALRDALIAEKERAEITLASIGDAVITTDTDGRVAFMNHVASALTGWPEKDALNRPLAEIFNIINETTREQAHNPVDEVLAHGKKVNLANHTILISRHGEEYPIEDSAAPIYLPDGRLLGCVLVFHDVSEKHALMKTMSWQAGHDVLTGLPNRALLADRFSRAIAAAQRQKNLLAVCMLDLDGFKPINDQYGHAIGDQVLIEVASRLKLVVRGEDTIARLGGDEFVLLLSEFTEPSQVEATLTRILAVLSVPYLVNDLTLTTSASVGIAIYPLDDADADTLMRHADQAMYIAKQVGRNRMHWFDAAHDQAAQTMLRTVERIRLALSQHELCLYYQPKVNMRTGAVTGMEALLRWQHPERGIVPPLEFLPVVEQHDLIAGIGEWVITEALRQISLWQAAGQYWRVSVNIAARHFQQDNFFGRLKTLLASHPDVDPRYLEIEILESIALGDLKHVQQLIRACQALGISFSLDDFGTGYSSLSYLKRLPAETIKIDQSFVRDMLEDMDDLSMIEAVINLATAFKRKVVAEGVETAEHGVMLMRLGCDVGQGYGIARPMSAQKVLSWAAQFKPDPKWVLWGKTDPWDMRDFPLLVAEHDHIQWVKNLIAAVTKQEPLQLSNEELTNHHLCRFGLWYYGYGKVHYGHLPEFIAIEPVHTEVHRIGKQIIQHYQQGERATAQALCQPLSNLKNQIVKQLTALHWVVLNDMEVEFTLAHDESESP